MRGLPLLIMLFIASITSAQSNRTNTLTCNNWLSTTSAGSGVTIGDLDVSGTTITVEAVFNRNVPYSGSFLYAGNIVSKHLDPNSTNYLLRPNSAEITTSNGYFVVSGPCLFNLNKTYHVAMVYNGSTLKFYRNGYLINQVAATGNLYQNNFITTIAEHAFGIRTPSETLLGYINEVRIWNVARTQAEIRANMSSALPTPTTQTGLLAYYTFDNLLNKQGNPAWNGTLIGSATINATNPACTFAADSCDINITPAATANFTAPDTVCINTPVNITNTSVGASTYFWNFCPPNLNINPQALNLGNVGNILSQPSFMDFVNDNGTYYGFSNNYAPGKLVRLNFGNSLLNTPTVTDLGNFGGIIPTGPGAEGIQVVKNEGKWYAIIVGGSPVGGTTPRIIKIDFGTSITNATPTATNWGNIGNLSQPVDLILFAENSIWYGLTVNSENNTVTRFNFSNSFNNTPIGTNLGNLGNLNFPTGLNAVNDNGTWRVFVTNGAYNTSNPNPSITRLDFGNSLLNLPTAVNLGNPGNFLSQPRDITIFSTCGQAFGYIVDNITNSIVKLNFNGNLQSVPTATSLGNTGNLSFPHSISKLFRSGADLYAFVTNINNNTITRLQFAGCTNSSTPNSTVQTPPPFIYTVPGTYTISLAVDEGMATQTTYCKQIVVLANPTIASRTDTTICPGGSVQLTTAATGATTFSWSPTTGLSNPLVASPIATPSATTTYVLTASNGYCQSTDTVIVNVNTNCTIAQAGFTIPDTVCVNTPVNIVNTSTGASSYYWNFCTGNLNQNPISTNLGNIGGVFSFPVFSDFAQYNGNYYLFVTNNSPGTLTRLDFGNSLLNTPTAVNLGNFGGVLSGNLESIQLVYNENKWYAIMVGGDPGGGNPSKIMKLDFGPALNNVAPTVTNWGNIGNLNYPIDLHIFQENNIWYGLTTNSRSNTITRFNFGTSFNNTPTGVNLGNPGNLLREPTGIYAINDNGFWRVFVTNYQSTYNITRLDFGNSLLNTPSAVNLGNINNIFKGPRDITILKFCGQATGFVVNGTSNELIKLNFNTGLQNAFTATTLGNTANFSLPHSISKVFRVGADLYSFITSTNNQSLVRLQFSGCSNSNIPNSTQQTPPAITYNTPGTYNINLSIDEGMATQSAFCKQLVVLAKPAINTRMDTSICAGSSVQLNSISSGATSYSWAPSTGLSNSNIASPIASPLVTTTYIVTASNGYCQSTDTVVVSVSANCNNISNVINSYTPVTGYLPCDNKLTVESDTAFNVGDTVLLIQMKGAVIDSTNTFSFGTVTDYRNAGNYEFNYVKSKSNNVIELKNQLTRQYTIPDGKVQLIRVPYFYSTSVSSTLTCLPWDGKKGGVLVFNVRDTLTLNADIDVSGKGFRGGNGIHGAYSTFNCSQSDFFYPADPYQAAEKGEGIYVLSAGKVNGKGKNTNGGGGGNSHNSGGSGGANGGSGGLGGYQIDGAPCTLTPMPADNRGIGGQSLVYNNLQNKIFLGGGAGAGQANNAEMFYPKGGNGGGIVIITANYVLSNNKNILLKGDNAATCNTNTTGCHEGMGGGGAGGTLLFNVNNTSGTLSFNTSGGNGSNMIVSGYEKLGPGGGGGGGTIWAKQNTLPNISVSQTGGINGINTSYNNDPWGATPGLAGVTVFNLKISVDTALFVKNIDSTRIKDSLISCNSIDFKGIAFTHTAPITNWQWTFGDGINASTQNISHTYQTTGSYVVKLIVTDANGCRDSISKSVLVNGANISDFSFRINPCSPLNVQFVSNLNSNVPLNNFWSFGDGTTLSSNQSPSHTFSTAGNYTVRYTNPVGNCIDTITKIISLGVQYQNLILTQDTTICYGTTTQIRTDSTNLFCWSPSIYLNNILLANPYAAPQQPITYYFTSLVTSSNLLANNDFSAGNIGFTSGYNYSANGTGSGQYFVGTNAGSWLAGAIACNTDHTTGTGNMLMVNGATTANTKIWAQTVAVTPNTNYEIAGWVANLSSSSPAIIQISIDDLRQDTAIIAGGNTCNWNRFSTMWNSGTKSSINISLINISTGVQGNDFAIDDLSFAPLSIKSDSIKINVDRPIIQASGDTAICRNDTTQLQVSGGSSYIWSPVTGLSNAIGNSPLAYPAVTTQYIVTGTSLSGCTAKDTVIVQIKPLPTITSLTPDTIICRNSSLQLNASGGISYSWLPAVTLNNGNIPNPIASPTANTTYYVNVKGANNCVAKDSVLISIKAPPSFAVQQASPACIGTAVQLLATGGNEYSWSPATGLSSTIISNPLAIAAANIQYSVKIKETICRDSTTLIVPVSVLPAPDVQAYRSNDIDCNIGVATLTATGGRTYHWTPGRNLSDSNAASPLATPVMTTVYRVTGIGDNGCVSTDTVMVVVKYDGAGMHYLPNAFTPNGDGLNDCFGIKSWGTVNELKFAIYDRWGEQVYSTTTPTGCWDGTFRGKPLQSGNYIYIIRAKTSCGDVNTKGSVLLVR